MDLQEISRVLTDGEFDETMKGVKTIGEFQQRLADFGVHVAHEEAEEIVLSIGEMEAQGNNAGELSEENLESVAGGGFIKRLFKASFGLGIKAFALGYYNGYERTARENS